MKPVRRQFDSVTPGLRGSPIRFSIREISPRKNVPVLRAYICGKSLVRHMKPNVLMNHRLFVQIIKGIPNVQIICIYLYRLFCVIPNVLDSRLFA